MNKPQLNESLSALADGECNDLDLQRVLNAASEDEGELKETWQRYHMIGAAMRDEQGFDIKMDISNAVRSAIAEENLVVKRPSVLGYVQNFAGKSAVAAAVAFAVVFGVQEYATLDATQEGATTVAENQAVVPKGFEQPSLSARTVGVGSAPVAGANSPINTSYDNAGGIPVDQQMMQENVNRLLFIHAKQVSETSSLGVIPFTRVQSFEAQTQE